MATRTFLVVIIYDISDNKTRNAMVDLLSTYGLRVQKSAFEAVLSRTKYITMMEAASAIINKETDSLRVYILNENVNVFTWGKGDCKVSDCIIF